MHELSLTRSIVAIAAEGAGGRRVTRVIIAVGKQAGVQAEAIAFCFEVLARGTAVDGAVLEILEPEGDELRVKAIEVEEPAQDQPG
jgi:hydrogenase nickel incorporation protein HypA/HybF